MEAITFAYILQTVYGVGGALEGYFVCIIQGLTKSMTLSKMMPYSIFLCSSIIFSKTYRGIGNLNIR